MLVNTYGDVIQNQIEVVKNIGNERQDILRKVLLGDYSKEELSDLTALAKKKLSEFILASNKLLDEFIASINPSNPEKLEQLDQITKIIFTIGENND
ncbi:MAG: hypothetical protein KDK72_09070 [Chlamydiia bacterium]|nr:hypothetical protein [Chlamydiia bacterium]